LGYGEGVGLQTRIIDVDFKNNAGDSGTRLDLSRELLCSAQEIRR
jgi:hypothetical protein